MAPHVLVIDLNPGPTKITRTAANGIARNATVTVAPESAAGVLEYPMQCGAGTPLGQQPTSSVMSTPAITISRAASVGSALCLMRRHQIRRLPVVDDGDQLCGMLTYGDTRRLKTLRMLQVQVPASADVLQRIAVHEVMTHHPRAVAPETSVLEAGQLMVAHKISGLPVVGPAGNVVGLVTERDLFEALVCQHD